jgi:hypothetical protein
MKMLDLEHFAPFRGDRLVKVLRHVDQGVDLWTLFRQGTFEDYQNDQSWDVFGNARHIITCIAERHNYAKFVRMWRVTSKHRELGGGRFCYETQKLAGFDDLVARLAVKWGDGTKSWAQWLHKKGNKEINEVLPPEYVMEFPGYYDFRLSYAQLCQMIDNPDSNREWHRMPSSISGVYMIPDAQSGIQYVGSAYGKEGIWGRWTAYAKDASGGNKLIKELLISRAGRQDSFQFAILRVLEPGCTKEQMIAHECLIKNKLGSRDEN